jgi:hypothetical protein
VHGAAACVTVKVRPPTVIAPLRELVAVFARTLNVTSLVPVPVPWAMSIQGTDFEADQLQLPAVFTVKRPLPPAAAKFCDVGSREKVQAIAVCRIVTVCPATVSVPERAPPVFAATATANDADPVPAVIEVMVNHDAPLLADHGQFALSVSCIVCVDAADDASMVSGATVGAQFGRGAGAGPGPGPD